MDPSSRVQQEYKLPRIHKGLKIADLKDEAIARGLDVEALPKKKVDLLVHLVDGSVHLKLAIDEIRRVLESELGVLRDENKRQGEKIVRAVTAKQSQELGVAQATASAMNEATASKSNEKKQQKTVGDTTSEQAGPQTKKQKKVLDQVATNHDNATGDVNNQGSRNLAECKDSILKMVERHIQLLRQCEEEKQAALAKACPPTYELDQFRENAKNPPSKSKTFASRLGFTVWSNVGEDFDPSKEFDTTWKTKEEANLRAKYLFYWKNCWGLHPNELMYESCFEEEISKQGLLSLHVRPVDADVWRVGVLPDVVFDRMDYTSTERRSYDDDSAGKPASATQDYFL